jgi:ribosomal protein S18 acetylase RimI-like enzyme
MTICELCLSLIDEHRLEIKSLLKQSFEISFPSERIDEDFLCNQVEFLREYMEQNKAKVFGALINGQLVGFVWVFEKESINSRILHINHLVVDEGFRRRGIGRLLLQAVRDYAIKRQVEEVELMVSKVNQAAIGFYEKNGFETSRYLMNMIV